MTKCSFCGREYELPRGLSLVLKDGAVKHLCSPKCRKNFYMHRRKVRWVTKKEKTSQSK